MRVARQLQPGRAVRLSLLSPTTSQSQAMIPRLRTTCGYGRARPPVASSISKSSIAESTRAPLPISKEPKPSVQSCTPTTTWKEERNCVSSSNISGWQRRSSTLFAASRSRSVLGGSSLTRSPFSSMILIQLLPLSSFNVS
jgi:hypothetical protein